MDWDFRQENIDPQYLLDGTLGSYMARSLGSYKCPADRIPAQNGPRVRSYSMNGFVGGKVEWTTYDYDPLHPSQAYRFFEKDAALTAPGPGLTWVFLDEHPDSINDTLFGVQMPPDSLWLSQPASWDDVPASYHNGACGFSFADGHAEIHKWLDNNTKPHIHGPPTTNPGCSASGSTSPRDSLWITQRNSAPL
jgi:prepilin-type processing-associated H-X9-DG protein